jgi:alpha-amylase
MKKLLTSLLSFLVVILLTVPVLTSCGNDTESEETPVTPPDTSKVTPQPTPTQEACQGWPANYEGVMLQGFYWDSYTDSKWTQLTAQANELSQYFSLIWIPNSGKTSDYYHNQRQTMGYDPCFWLDHNSCWGTEAELRQMIATFKQKGTGIIEDVVINHKNGLSSWVDFPDETKYTYSIKWDNTNYSAICRNDECNQNGYKTTGANDTGDNFDGYRDLDHTNATVQQNVKTYLDYLIKELGYVGFRYDLVKGYKPKYTGMYNASAQPQYSVGECWDANKGVVTDWLNGTKQDDIIQSAAFDFPLKYKINSAFNNGYWLQLAQPALANDQAYQRYAVTFIDNHDTYRENDRLRSNVCAANAYILCMPGTPCLFLKHWQAYKGTLKRLITLRKAAGINNQSKIESAKANANGFTLKVKGDKGSVLLLLGKAESDDTSSMTLALKGKNYAVYTDGNIDLTAVKAITEEDAEAEDDAPVTIPDFCTVEAGETCAFFEAPASWGDIKCWRWDKQYNYTGNKWPGVDCTLVGNTSKGKKVWKWSWDGNKVSQSSSNEGIIFNDGSNQTGDLPFQNGGYYTEEGMQGIVKANAG